MANRHTLTHAEEMYQGNVSFSRGSPDGRRGVRIDGPFLHSFGAPVTLLADGLVDAATGAELPDTATTTYTPDDDGSSPIDKTGRPSVVSLTINDTTVSAWALDVPRNVTLAVTAGTALVAGSVTVTGYEAILNPSTKTYSPGSLMVETLSWTASGTSKSDDGLKAFGWITSIAITSAGDLTGDSQTLNVGFGDVLGLPYRIDAGHQVVPFGDGVVDASATVVVADTNAVTATTGDVRGTVDFATASDGTAVFAAWIIPTGRDTKENVFGVEQFGG